ncbi:MAG TPA: SPFH domain-containing protein [Polyangiaceae bacterium LLY-WYZ-15_(1-7)]|nr:SPFH domain-containing protein [Polyangiaceae bacterium LLY-WYZ-15_(1-7)]HJL04516.1 SPFH domain-containing protein [Polyangiaceae bacterium LLY-WYZ-15_(1-7)]HJL08522.1 SPFH domain-containing protein [Polyangiaceae bacterium LLY-WYZ-15_(1-7)]HJL22827.1 SPFH domain-containing protein [Polyangiaceae bacterium LLY-WYZ-15_(1-7)]HJL30504.1 SPFH domain-containing protein [Polyangiaceae bacterium LLY-WYZ-15_(1-7)]
MVLGKVFGFVKDGVQEMLIQRPDEHKQLIVYKHPENTIPNYAQLTVDADESAVFFRDGSVVGVMRTAGAGQRHTLNSQNIPFLGQLVDRVTGGNIFVTDLYFVTMRPIYDQPFGGELGYMEDPMLGEMVTPRIFGKFAIQIVDPARFIVNYTGLQSMQGGNEQVLTWIKDAFLNSVKSVVGQVCVTEQKSLLQLMPLQNQLARMFEQHCPDLESIGVKILQVADFNINLSDEDEETLKAAQAEIGKAKREARIASIGIAKAQAEAAQKQFELDQEFQQDARYTGLAGGDFGKMAAGKAMIGAGKGMAQGPGEGGGGGGNPMMAGAGLGAGFGMAQAFGQAFQGGAPGQAPPGQHPGHPPQGGHPGHPPQGGAPQGGGAPPAAPQAGGQVTCPACNASVPGGKFCAECGNSLSPAPKFCPSCGAQNGPGARFCSNCGTGLPD